MKFEKSWGRDMKSQVKWKSYAIIVNQIFKNRIKHKEHGKKGIIN